MITSMIRTMTSSMVSSMIPSDVESRVFIEGDSVLQTHYVYSSPITLAGDFEIEVNVVPQVLVSVGNVLGESTDNENFLDIDLTGRIRLRIDGFDITALNAIDNYIYSHILATRVGTTVNIIVNGVQKGTGTTSNTMTVDRIGRRFDGNFFNGIIANVSINDIDAGEITTFRLDEATANIEFPVEGAVGSELSPQPTVDLANWGTAVVTEDIVGDEIRFTAISGLSGRGKMTISGLTIGNYYAVEIKARRGAQGTDQRFQSWTFATIPTTPITSTSEETYSFLVMATATSGLLNVYAAVSGSAGDEVLVSDVSVKLVNTMTYVNIPTSIRDTYTLVDDGVNWLGVELVVNGGFDTDSDWTKNGNWTIAGGVAIGNEVTSTLLTQFRSLGPATYREGFTITDFVSGTLKINSGGGGATRSADGVYLQDRAANADSLLRLNPSFGSGFVGNVDNVTRKRLIEIA